MTRGFRRCGLLAAVAACGLAAFASTASAAVAPSRVAVASIGPGLRGGRGCPMGSYVTVAPGVSGSPVFLLIPPGPAGCPPGVDVLVDPGAQQSGTAVALPLGGADCAAGIGVLDEELGLLGQPPPAGPGNPQDACPAYAQTLAALEGALPAVQRGAFGLAFTFGGGFGRFAPAGTLVFVGGGPFAAQAPFTLRLTLDASGSPVGVVTLGRGGSAQTFTFADGGTPGVSGFGGTGPITS
jgi:hypothetical protein